MARVTPSDVKKVLGRVIAYNTSYAFLPGVSVPGAVFLSQAFYWGNNPKSESREGWFYKKQRGYDSWEAETGLSLKQQVSARKALVGLGVLEEKRRDLPAKVWYRVNCERLQELQKYKGPSDSEDEVSPLDINSILGRLIAYYPDFTLLTGLSVTGAVFLSQAFYWADNDKAKEREGWFYKKQRGEDSWEYETGLSPKQQANARKFLVELGILEEERKDVPAKVWYRINCENLLKLLVEKIADKPLAESGISQFTPLGDTGLPYGHSGKPKAAPLNRQKGKSITETTSKNTAKNNSRISESEKIDLREMQKRRAEAERRGQQKADFNARHYGSYKTGKDAFDEIRRSFCAYTTRETAWDGGDGPGHA
ncbi:hypothetical protein [Halomonas litopenaei]|uniref:hypothetical protein n=1 Tax=Halomonas litopenaei TaxID=2109328 RepID=UPI001A8CD141|nr:hypothetical protein [Halomonas litopenaei]MBN8411445.1 hypothetical protein [Halomonas litopenaei]